MPDLSKIHCQSRRVGDASKGVCLRRYVDEAHSLDVYCVANVDIKEVCYTLIIVESTIKKRNGWWSRTNHVWIV